MIDERDRMIQKQAERISALNKQIENDYYYYGDLKQKAAKNASELAFMKALDTLVGSDDNVRDAFEALMLVIRMGHGKEFDDMIKIEASNIQSWASGRIF